jgi:hypothetical protein
MRLPLTAFTLSLLLHPALTAVAQRASQTLDGSWYAETRSEGVVGILFEFTPDGKFRYSLGAISEYRYRFEGGKLILNFLDPHKGPQPDEAIPASIMGGKLAIANIAQQTVLDYSRSGQPEAGANPIVGFWTRMEETNGNRHPSNRRFRKDGTAVFTVPFAWRTGVYSITGDQIRLILEGKPPVEGPWRLDGPVLILPAAQGPARFHRL